MKKCYIFGAVDISTDKIPFNKGDSDIVIAADKGLNTLQKLGVTPDLIIGDFDSLGFIPSGENIIKHPVVKDDTDTMLCVKTALDMGYKCFEIYGCIGGRLDHTIANIQTASFIADNDGVAVFYDEKNETALTVIKDNLITFSCECKGKISVFSLSDLSTGVAEKGLFYELENSTLTNGFPLGVSNEFAGKDAVIGVKKGKLCIIWDNATGCFNIGGNYD